MSKRAMWTMPVNSPLPTDTRSRHADWLETLCLARSRGRVTRADVLRLLDRFDDGGHVVEIEEETGDELDSEILEGERSGRADEVLTELEYRERILGARYPFALEMMDVDWSLRRRNEQDDPKTTAARSSYLFCLLACAIRDQRVSGAGTSDLTKQIPDLFQAIATKAAAGALCGEAISFGWPRPERTGFRQALQGASRRLGLGRVLDEVPLWSSGKEKDASIDVIAWRDLVDKRPGKLVLFGQVASGNDWTEKSVKNDISIFLSWFSEQPTKHYLPAIFIPFPQHHSCAGKASETFEDVAVAEAWLREQKFGLVIDRLRIVGFAADHMGHPGNAGDSAMLADVGHWNDQTIALARSEA